MGDIGEGGDIGGDGGDGGGAGGMKVGWRHDWPTCMCVSKQEGMHPTTNQSL